MVFFFGFVWFYFMSWFDFECLFGANEMEKENYLNAIKIAEQTNIVSTILDIKDQRLALKSRMFQQWLCIQWTQSKYHPPISVVLGDVHVFCYYISLGRNVFMFFSAFFNWISEGERWFCNIFIAFLENNENWLFPVLWPLLVFQICWHIECTTLTESSFRIWNSSADSSYW